MIGRGFTDANFFFIFRYTEVINITGAGKNHILQSIINSDADAPLPIPDYSQMIPYKPKSNPLPGEHPVPGMYCTNYVGTYLSVLIQGGAFPHPPVAAHLCTLLPPPACFRGPFVNIDLLMDIFNRIQLPDTVPQPTENGADVKL